MLGYRARDVMLRNVRNFVRQNRRQLGFGLTEKNQASVDADETTRKRKGVDRWIADREELEIEWRTWNCRYSRFPSSLR